MASCYEPGMTIFTLMDAFSAATKNPFSLHWTPYTMKFIGIFLLLYGGAILFYYTGQKNTRPGEEHGSASWGSVRELDKKYRDKDAGKNVILTQHLQMSMNGKQHRRNLLQIIVGGSGSGKTRFLAKPNLMLANASFIVTDPKGEMLRAVGNLFLEEGYVLRVFDLIDPSKSDCYNPFCYIRKDADVFKLIDNFIKNTTPKGAKANDPFWEKSETALDAALMLYLLHEAPVEDQNMETILYMIENGGAKEEDDDYQSPLDLLFEALEEEQPNHIAVRQYHIFKQAAGKTAKSILVSAAVRLASFTLPEIQRIAASDEDIKEVNQKIVKQSEPVVKNIMSGKIPKSADIKLSGRGFGSKSSVTSHAADSIPMGAVKMKDTGATADVGWEKSDNSEHFYVKFINWGTIYRPPQEFIYATGREADAELQKIAEQEYQSYLDNTLK